MFVRNFCVVSLFFSSYLLYKLYVRICIYIQCFIGFNESSSASASSSLCSRLCFSVYIDLPPPFSFTQLSRTQPSGWETDIDDLNWIFIVFRLFLSCARSLACSLSKCTKWKVFQNRIHVCVHEDSKWEKIYYIPFEVDTRTQTNIFLFVFFFFFSFSSFFFFSVSICFHCRYKNVFVRPYVQ